MQTLERRVESNDSILDRPLAGLTRLSWEGAAYLGLLAIALVMRYWDLGTRMLHHDESLHALYSWYLYVGRGYQHDPMMHGPLQFHFMALIYFIFGATDATARFGPAIFGTVLVGLPYLLRQELGRAGALIAALLLTLSPSFLYFSRFARNDIYMAVWTLLMVIGMFRYVQTRNPRWLLLWVAALSCSFTQKETAYITVAILGSFLLIVAGGELVRLLKPAPRLSALGDLLVITSTLVGPLLTAFIILLDHLFGIPTSGYWVLGGTFVVLMAVCVLIGYRWNSRLWLWSAALFWSIFLLLYTTFFSNPQGFASGAVGSLEYWIAQQEVARGGQPWFYYLVLLPLYDFVPVIFGLVGVAVALRRRDLFSSFLMYWLFGSLVLYGWASEKMPWLVLYMALPFALLAAYWLGQVVEGVDWRKLSWKQALYFALGLTVALVALASVWRESQELFSPMTELEAQRQFFRLIAVVAILAGVLYAITRTAASFTRGVAWRLSTLVLFAILMVITVRAAVQVSYYNGDVPVEMMVYTQTSPDVGRVMREIDRVGFRTGAGKDVVVAYDNSVSWPFEWYLRDYRQRAYFGRGTPSPEAPIVLVGFEDNNHARVAPMLRPNYVGQRYRLRWWFAEDYRDIRPDSFWWAIADAETRTRLWNYFIYRETFSPLGSTDFMMYVRKDLVAGPWETASGVAGRSAAPDLSMAATVVPARLSFGIRGVAEGQMVEPKNIAVAPDGTLYVVDTFNHRIQHFDAQGGFLASWGEQGDGPGQFSEPWGIAVDSSGNVYVADTWNHRIQKFDSQGRFIAAWGRQMMIGVAGDGDDGFFGPRAVVIDGDGDLWITDTGNHRIARYTAEGRLVGYYGSRGSASGQFNEPVGLTIDTDGYFYVADTWNHRIQKFDRSFAPVAEWPVGGWDSESVVNKPYLAVDSIGHLYVSDPENHRVLAYSTSGRLLRIWGGYGSDEASLNLPTGLSTSRDGVLVVDSGNCRVLEFPLLSGDAEQSLAR